MREGIAGGTIGGGGNSAELFLGGANFVTGDYGTVSGGKRNTADKYATVGGGDQNVASGCSSTVAGGHGNVASGEGATVGGGGAACFNSDGSGGWVGGNTASGYLATVSGGGNNDAIGGSASILGGHGNRAAGDFSTVLGGSDNTASGYHSLAAGEGAQANHDGTFVWADVPGGLFSSTGPSQFLIRAAGGVGINTNAPQGDLDVNGSIYQRGNSLHADYVFEPDYKLESIEEHSRLMWARKHLPALNAGAQDSEGRDVVEYGSRLRGILEELEKAHVYIQQLNARLAKLEAMLGER